MRPRIDWLNATIYAAFTGAAALLLYWFVARIGERLGGVEWAILLTATLAAGALIALIALRWYAGTQVRQAVDTVLPAAQSVFSDLQSGGPEVVTKGDLAKIFGELRVVGPAALRIGGVLLAVTVLVTLIGEILLLANAAVMYLQAERLRQQNELIRIQSEVSEAAFLNDLVTNLSRVVEEAEKASQRQRSIEGNIISPLQIVSAFIPGMTEFTALPEIAFEGYAMSVCLDVQACNSFEVEALAEEAKDGSIRVGDENRSALTGYFRLTSGLQHLHAPFSTMLGNRESTINADIAAVETLLNEASLVCGFSSEARGKLLGLWQGLSGASLASVDMWPDGAEELVQANGEIVLDPSLGAANFLALAASGKLLRQVLGEDADAIIGPQDYADTIARGLEAFEASATSLMQECEGQSARTVAAVEALNRRRDELITRITAGSSPASPP